MFFFKLHCQIIAQLKLLIALSLAQIHSALLFAATPDNAYLKTITCQKANCDVIELDAYRSIILKPHNTKKLPLQYAKCIRANIDTMATKKEPRVRIFLPYLPGQLIINSQRLLFYLNCS
jgi:hypothetical protein